MKIQSAIACLLVAFFCGCDTKDGVSTANTGSDDSSSATYLGAMAKAQKSAVKAVDTAALNSAIQMFAATEGRYPKDLNELVAKKYLPELPPPPHGMKFEYDAKTGTAKVVPQ